MFSLGLAVRIRTPYRRLLSTISRNPFAGYFPSFGPQFQQLPVIRHSLSAFPALSTDRPYRPYMELPFVKFHEDIDTAFDFVKKDDLDHDRTLYADSVLRKRRLKMKKHKLRKRRRAQRSLKKRLGKL